MPEKVQAKAKQRARKPKDWVDELPRPLKRQRAIQQDSPEQDKGDQADDEAEEKNNGSKRRQMKAMKKQNPAKKPAVKEKSKGKAQPKQKPDVVEGIVSLFHLLFSFFYFVYRS